LCSASSTLDSMLTLASPSPRLGLWATARFGLSLLNDASSPMTDDDGEPLVCAPGQIYGGCEIVRFMAAGGTCQIYEARHAIMQRRVAIKVQKAHLRSNGKRSHRIASEAMALAAIDHPNVVRVFHADVDERVGLYIVQEFLQGRDLRRTIDDLGKTGRRLAIKVASAVALEIADAIGSFHEVGILHRDLKPDNIFLHERKPGDVVVKVLDLGIAKLPQGKSKTTDKQIAVGTLPYMAPEQLLEGVSSAQSDVYALALVYDEMLSGKHAFSPGSAVLNPALRDSVIRARILGGIYDPLSVRVSGFPRPLSDFVGRCLARSPSDRPATMLAFADELRRVVRSLDEVPSEAKAPPAAATPPAATARTEGPDESTQRTAATPTSALNGQRPKPAGGTDRITPAAPARKSAESNNAPLLPPFAVPLASKLEVPSFVLTHAPGAWRFLRIPLLLKPSASVLARGLMNFGQDGEVPLPGLPRMLVQENHEGDFYAMSSQAELEGVDSRKPLRAYATFKLGPYTFTFVPPTPNGLGIPPDYEKLTVPRDTPLHGPSLLIKAGHKLTVDRVFPLRGARQRVGGEVDLEVPLFRLNVALAATLDWNPHEGAFVVTRSPAAAGVRLSGSRADQGLLAPFGAIEVDGWHLVLLPAQQGRRA
jgi:serine/threonine protein kinase